MNLKIPFPKYEVTSIDARTKMEITQTLNWRFCPKYTAKCKLKILKRDIMNNKNCCLAEIENVFGK